MDITLHNFANHLFPANLKAHCFLDWFYPCSEWNARNKVFFTSCWLWKFTPNIGKWRNSIWWVFSEVLHKNKNQQLKRKISSCSVNRSLLMFFLPFSLRFYRVITWISNVNSWFLLYSQLKKIGWGKERKWHLVFQFNKEAKKSVEVLPTLSPQKSSKFTSFKALNQSNELQEKVFKGYRTPITEHSLLAWDKRVHMLSPFLH